MLQVLSRVSRPRAACVLKSAGLLSSSFSTSPSSDNVVEVDGCNLHVKVQGPTTGDKKLLLCLPGAMGTAETDWQYQFEGLSEAHTVVCDGHDVGAIQKALAEAKATKGKPTAGPPKRAANMCGQVLLVARVITDEQLSRAWSL